MNSSQQSRRSSRAVWVGTLLVLLASTAVWAGTRPGATDSGRHCVASLEPIQPGAKASRLASLECFSSFADAISAATDGTVWVSRRDDLRTQLEAATQQLHDGVVTTSSFVLAIDYVDAGFGGQSLTWTGTGACSSSTSFGAGSMPSGWDNVVSSTRGFSNCNSNILWENTNFTGAQVTCHPDCSNVGPAMNDRTSSRQWHL